MTWKVSYIQRITELRQIWKVDGFRCSSRVHRSFSPQHPSEMPNEPPCLLWMVVYGAWCLMWCGWYDTLYGTRIWYRKPFFGMNGVKWCGMSRCRIKVCRYVCHAMAQFRECIFPPINGADTHVPNHQPPHMSDRGTKRGLPLTVSSTKKEIDQIQQK